MKKKIKVFKKIGIILAILIVIGVFFPTWTPSVDGENSISELREVEINGTKLQLMIRGCDRGNPILLFVHGGPCCSEIPYVVKYQREWEEKFTIVHYDQRGSGKSYHFFEDYSDVTVNTHIEDLLALTQYITDYFGKEQVILVGHSFGTYIAINAASIEPDLYQAYVGIGQMSDPIEGELENLERCVEAAKAKENIKDVVALESMTEAITKGEMITPREYVRKNGLAARKIDENVDYVEGFLLRPEYNLMDVICYYAGAKRFQDRMIEESIANPLPTIVTKIDIPVYFLMGKYDAMTSPKTAKEYMDSLICEEKEFVYFEESAHYPQFEESDVFLDWLCVKFL